MSDLWVDLFEKNKNRYIQANPKRGRFIHNYFYMRGLVDSANNYSFLELGAFSAKDSVYLKDVFPGADFYLSDLQHEILKATSVIQGFAGDVFKLPLRDNSIDVSFHSGLIILFNNENVKNIIDSQYRVTKKYSFIFGLNKFNFLDYFISFYKYKIMGNALFKYRRFTKRELFDMAKGIDVADAQVYYHDNMMENFAKRSNSSILKFIAKLFIFKLPFFYNEVVLVVEKKCVG